MDAEARRQFDRTNGNIGCVALMAGVTLFLVFGIAEYVGRMQRQIDAIEKAVPAATDRK